ncbi:MAG: hypothetical protein HXX11_23610 [Desulfuromonadales bacterium]|nr:hypothetical protein [Desulfuromonadales bacterium]
MKREMVSSIDDKELKELHERDAKLGKFWFRLYVNDCANADELYLHLLGIGLLEFQARQACVNFCEYENSKGETIAEIFGMKEGETMSFIVTASSEEELKEKVVFFVEGINLMKKAVIDCLLHRIPEWVAVGKKLTI